MSTDRELLELAARAAGMDGWRWTGGSGMHLGLSSNSLSTVGFAWNPLTDDGDALRLAVQLELEIRVFNGKAHAGKQDKFWCTEAWFPDGGVFAATRRAIVRAAAEIGRAMP